MSLSWYSSALSTSGIALTLFFAAKYDAGIESVGLPPLENVKEITIDSAISHGKEAACLCTYNLNEKTHHIGFFLEFTTHKATALASIVVTSH